MYRGKRKTEMPPHIFSITDNAYRDMLQGMQKKLITLPLVATRDVAISCLKCDASRYIRKKFHYSTPSCHTIASDVAMLEV